MPESLIHCISCRTLLNSDLDEDSVEIPAFVPLQEIESNVDLAPRGYYIQCPECRRELRVNRKLAGASVQCNSCRGKFTFDISRVVPIGYYADCPHCKQRLRMSRKYAGLKVACKFCSGRIRLLPE